MGESAFCEFISCFLNFYRVNSKAATAFVEELITSVSIRENILIYAKNKFGADKNLMVLNSILNQDDVKAYSLLDELFELSIKKMNCYRQGNMV